jgi:gliding motility-associated-like protein
MRKKSLVIIITLFSFLYKNGHSQCENTGTDVKTACESFTWIDGNTYTTSNNTATHILTNAAGCDSTVTLDLTVNNSSTGTDVKTACESFTWIDGNTYTTSNNTATHILTNASGCDSIITLNLTVNYSNTGTDTQVACDSYTWIDGITYTSSNNSATYTLNNVANCDSVVTLNLTVNYSNSGTDTQVTCDSYTWIDGITYTSSNNSATHTLTNSSGCDSIVTLNLTINSNTGTDTVVACDSYTWIDGITYTSNNNSATHILTNASGCDSLVTLNLEIKISSLGPTGITSSDSVICENTDVTLIVDGGFLGTNSQWVWFNDSCGGNIVGNGASIIVNQSSNTTYFIRAEGDCNNTICENVTVSNLPYFIELDSISIDSTFNSTDGTWSIVDTVCPQTAVKLFAHFSNPFPQGYSITWYKNSCGATSIGVGDSIVVFPDSSTTYYAKVTGTCGASLCKQVTITTKDGSLSPTEIQTSSNNFCTGGSTTLSIVGGQLGTGANWSWYESACGSNFLGTGSSISVTPAASTMYYVRANGGTCGSTSCSEILINTYDLNVYHSAIDSTCESSSFILQGGFPQGGIYSGIGVLDSIFDPNISGIGSHTVTYTYSDSNNCTDSTQFQVVVLEPNIDPSLIGANLYEICNGNSSTISLDPSNQIINGSQWFWYKGSCGTGDLIASTISNNQITVSPSTTSNYYVRAEGGLCPASNCVGVTIDVYTLEAHLNEFEDICGDDYPLFDLEGGSPSGGLYSGNGVINGVFSPKIAGVGVHNITYTYNLGPCIATDVETINIENSPLNVYYSIEQETCAEGGIMIHAHTMNGSGYYEYQWSDGSYNNPLTYANNDIYNVLVSDADNCFKLLDSISFDNELECIEMVNTFTPNGDGINDIWNPDFSNYDKVLLIILNKWGNEIIQFNSSTIQWDGKTKEGVDLPSGTYYYILELTKNLDETTQSGPITIIR